jgi:hypothetical protein
VHFEERLLSKLRGLYDKRSLYNYENPKQM